LPCAGTEPRPEGWLGASSVPRAGASGLTPTLRAGLPLAALPAGV